MKIEELIQCLEAVSEYEKGEGENIIQYENEFLLSNKDVKELLKYIKNKDSVIKEVREYIEKHTYHGRPKKLQNGIYERGILLIKSDFDIEDLLEILDKENKQ